MTTHPPFYKDFSNDTPLFTKQTPLFTKTTTDENDDLNLYNLKL